MQINMLKRTGRGEGGIAEYLLILLFDLISFPFLFFTMKAIEFIELRLK